ncbi:MAG: hypothetical protein KIT11_08480 [Fimbriimonadaceae bacterium]|nr:hypothetical protein [Fimbriimonadaceae bacterium]QYK56389.1 MAG: hypothetical protein KF733_02675 [Fimbriimonadaceae bacterium]
MRTYFLLGMLLLALALVGCGGGGGNGGGGGGQTVTLFGRVVWIETGAPPNPTATVRAGTASTATDPIDGYFEVSAPRGVSSVSVTYTPPGGSAIVRTFNFPPATATTDLGDLYVGPTTVTVRGVVVNASTNAAVAGATVTIGGQRGTSDSSGAFSVPGVAYSANGLAVFLGLEGRVTANGFFARSFSPPSGPSGNIVQVGSVALTPQGSGTPPPPPHNVQGRVLPANEGGQAVVRALVGSSVVRTARADANGNFSLWLPVGSYTIRATKGTKTGETTLQVASTNVVKTVDVTLQ